MNDKKCKTCGSSENYNYEINNGLCNSCIEDKLEQLEAELENCKKDMCDAGLLTRECYEKWLSKP